MFNIGRFFGNEAVPEKDIKPQSGRDGTKSDGNAIKEMPEGMPDCSKNLPELPDDLVSLGEQIEEHFRVLKDEESVGDDAGLAERKSAAQQDENRGGEVTEPSKEEEKPAAEEDQDRGAEESGDDSEGTTENEQGAPIENKKEGMRREREAEYELRAKYPEEQGYEVLKEVYLRDKNGEIVRDPITGEARRVDFVVVNNSGTVVESVEVTSKSADKTAQTEKEDRIRANGGNYVKNPDTGEIHEIPADMTTRIERRS